jgi:hypothetical protein
MSRVRLLAVAIAFLPVAGTQDPHDDGPPGPRGGPVEVIQALFVQAQMIEGGRAMFCFPRDTGFPSLIVGVDGKEVRALGSDLKPLNVAELGRRLPGYTGVVVVQAEFELPDAFFLKVLNERSVIFVLPAKMYAPMAKASQVRPAPGQPIRP